MTKRNIVPRADNALGLSEVEWFLFLKMVRDAIGKELDTGNKSNTRGAIDAAYKKLWEKTGGKTYDMRMRGQKVATYSVKTTKEKTRDVYDLQDAAAFGDWLFSSDGQQAAVQWADENPEQFVKWCVETNGEIPPGVQVRTVITQAEGEYGGGAVSRFQQQQVLKALGDDLPMAVAGLLGGSDE